MKVENSSTNVPDPRPFISWKNRAVVFLTSSDLPKTVVGTLLLGGGVIFTKSLLGATIIPIVGVASLFALVYCGHHALLVSENPMLVVNPQPDPSMENLVESPKMKEADVPKLVAEKLVMSLSEEAIAEEPIAKPEETPKSVPQDLLFFENTIPIRNVTGDECCKCSLN